VHPEVEELKPKLKEILYDCAVEIRATKAALYLDDGEGRFELVTEYGFRGMVRARADANDPMRDRCGRGRTPFFINGVGTEPRFSELLYQASTEHLLAAPIYSRGALVGMIDMRDKAQKQPFELADIAKAQAIADRIAELFFSRHVFGRKFIALSDLSHYPHDGGVGAAATPPPASVPATPTAPAAPPGRDPAPPAAPSVAAPAPVAVPRTHVPRLATLVLEARTAAARLVLPSQPASIGEPEIAAVRDLLRAVLLIPGALAAVFSSYDSAGGAQEIAARGAIGEEGQHFLQSKLNIWLSKRGEGGSIARANVTTPFGTATTITAAAMQKVFTAPVVAEGLRGLYLTVAFDGPPDRTSHETLAMLLNQLQLAIEHSLRRQSTATLRLRAAEKLVEPEFTAYPELRRHTSRVAALCDAFARTLNLSPHEAETLRLTAMVHDAGMRLLDYERLYRKKDLSADELGILREHVSIGAVLAEPLLGNDVARAVLCHHERVDGKGYPNELHGAEIPLVSRVLQLCDAWVAMTDPESYQSTASRDEALAVITRGAGSQFDGELAGKFVEMMRGA
jgi:hypothetical protein